MGAVGMLFERIHMKAREQMIERLVQAGIIAVVRAPETSLVLPLSEALVAGGVIAIEITMTTPNAFQAIRSARQHFGDRAIVGVGTVLDKATAQSAIQAGAQFVVSPIARLELTELAHQAHCPIMLGAYTPTEAQMVFESGADFVKLFPADGLGIGYIKALRAPLPHLRIVPTGGVDLNNAADFLQAGCAALGVGSSLVSSAILREKNWSELTRLAAQFMEAVKKGRASKK